MLAPLLDLAKSIYYEQLVALLGAVPRICPFFPEFSVHSAVLRGLFSLKISFQV